MHVHERTDPAGNHSFTSRDSGTGDSVPTEHHHFPPPPQPAQPREFGDEAWMTNSLMRSRPSQQNYDADAPFVETSDSFYDASGGYGYGQYPGSFRRNPHRPKFSTFMDDQSDTSSMSTALLNGHMSPNFDGFPSSAQNTLERRHHNPDYEDGDSVIPTIPEDETIVLTSSEPYAARPQHQNPYPYQPEPHIFKN